jgi:hypothetical protein
MRGRNCVVILGVLSLSVGPLAVAAAGGAPLVKMFSNLQWALPSDAVRIPNPPTSESSSPATPPKGSSVQDVAQYRLSSGVRIRVEAVLRPDYAGNVNTAGRLGWLQLQGTVFRSEIARARELDPRSASLIAGDRIGQRYRVLFGRTTWTANGQMLNRVFADIFHEQHVISVSFQWTGQSVGPEEKVVDAILSSISVSE